MTREYLRVRPTSEQLQPALIPDAIASLHKLTAVDDESSRRLPFRHPDPPIFEFLAISEGEGEPVEFYYGVDGHLDTVEKRLRTIYPPSFDIDRVECDIVQKLLCPVEYSPEEFTQRVEDGQLYHEPTVAIGESAEGPVVLDTSVQADGPEVSDKPPSATGSAGTTPDGGIVSQPDSEGGARNQEETPWDGDEDLGTDPAGPPRDDESDEESDDGPEPVIVDVAPSSVVDDDGPLTRLEQPTFTEQGTILARPAVSEASPCGVRWCGKVDRRTDWMTTLTPFTEVLSEERDSDEGGHGRAPLATLIDHLTEASEPLAFQVLFQRKPDWSRQARRRSGDILAGKDTLTQKLLSIESAPRRTEPSMRDREKEQESVTRLDLVRENTPKRTFTVNVRAIALPTDETAVTELDSWLDALCPALDRIDGDYYEIEGQRLRERSHRLIPRRRKTADARTEFEHLRTRTLVTRRSGPLPNPTNRPDIRADLVLNADELANLIVVPSATDLTIEGGRGTQAEQQSRNPLPLPHHDLMRQFHEPGQSIGLALDQNGDPESVPTNILPHLLPYHVGRFAKTGAGKSIALINDALSLYESTDGPVFIVDSKGGSLPKNYMRAHAKKFGFDDLEENVLHFPMPAILPGFSFFDLRRALTDPMANTSRENVVQDTADHYEEIIKLVMGEDRYEQAIVAPNLIKYLIKMMFDEEHGLENGWYRESVDYFGHSQLEHAVTQLYAAGPPQQDPDAAPRSSDDGINEKIARHLETDPTTFANIMGGVSNRMDYITQDAHLRKIFDNVDSRFDFRELLDEHKVIILDLGGLRDDAAQILTGVVLTSLYDAVKDRDPEVIAAKPDDYVINVVIDEAATVVASDVLNTLLERGREFRLSIELVTQFPQQMELKGSREVYLNVLTNIGARLIGKITVDDEIADALAYEDLDPVEFRNRISALPRGEWIAQLPEPAFGETGPTPFHVQALPIPAGHQESDDPLTDREEERFQEVLERVHENTQAEYGVPTTGAPPTASVPDPLQELLNTASEAVDDALATVVWHVQVQEGVRETNGWVPVLAVDETLRAWFEDSAVEGDPPDPAELTEIRRRSRLFELDVDIESGDTLVRLTDAGEEVAEPNTGDVQTAGGQAHDDALARVQNALTRLGFRVSIVAQDGSDQPDAIARNDALDIPLNVEVETTTHTKPTKILTNLKKAQAMEHVPLFVVANDEEEAGLATARRVERILDEPVRRRDEEGTEFYNLDSAVSFNGGAPTKGGVTAVRPTTGDSRRTIWTREEDEYILTDAEGIEHARVSDVATAPKDRFPAIYSYDRSTGEYTVYEAGETHHYDSKAAFRDDWVKIKRPFIPEDELPVPDYGRDSYAIVILRVGGKEDETEGAAVEILRLYEGGETTSLETIDDLLSSLVAGSGHSEKQDSRVNDPESANETDSVNNEIYEDEDTFLKAFVDTRVIRADGNYLPVAEAYAAYASAAAEHEIPVRNTVWFSKMLGEHIEVERTRKRVDGTLTRCYVGIDLVDTDERL